jgi:hypothetical protein
MRLEDEFGETVKVAVGDPAARLVGELRRLHGVDIVVLPRYTYITGALSGAYDSGDIVRDTRLRDCLSALGGS